MGVSIAPLQRNVRSGCPVVAQHSVITAAFPVATTQQLFNTPTVRCHFTCALLYARRRRWRGRGGAGQAWPRPSHKLLSGRRRRRRRRSLSRQSESVRQSGGGGGAAQRGRARRQSPEFQRHSEDVPASVDKTEDNVTANHQGSECEDNPGLWPFAVWSEELTFELQQLQRRTEQELGNINTQLVQIEDRRQLLNSELSRLHKKKKQNEQDLRRSPSLQRTTFQLCDLHELQASITERVVQSEGLLFQEEALCALRDLLSQDQQRYQEETTRLSRFTQRVLQPSHRSEGEDAFTHRRGDQSMQGKNETGRNNNMTTNQEEAEQFWRSTYMKPSVGLSHSSNLRRARSIKDLINKFSGSEYASLSYGTLQCPTSGVGRSQRWVSMEALPSAKATASSNVTGPVPTIKVCPPLKDAANAEDKSAAGDVKARMDGSVEAQTVVDSGRDSMADSGMGSESEFDLNKRADSPTVDEPQTPKVTSAKYQLFLNNDVRTNDVRTNHVRTSHVRTNGLGGGKDTDASGPNHYRGSLESLTSRDWDTTSDRLGVVDSPPRVFNSPYTTTASMDYNPVHRMSEYKVQSGLSPATSEMNLYSMNHRSTSPVGIQSAQRSRFSTYDTLRRRPEVMNPVMNTVINPVVSTHYSLRSATLGAPNKKDYIEELTKQLDICQKRNQFLEAESVEMEKERNQIRFEMRALLVNNEDLLRTNTQMSNEMKKMREQMLEMERENQLMAEKYREMEVEVRQARDIMVEANTQEYAFNFLQQSLKNKIQDAEESVEKQTQHAQTLAEKLWLAERQLEEFEVDKETKDKKTSELTSTIIRLETELSEAVQVSTQAAAEMNLQKKLRDDAHLRVEELEEALLEKEQEVQKLQIIVGRLQGEVSGKLIDKEQTLEEEIQLREKLQLQCKQAERTVDDLHMELQAVNQTRDDLSKQLKQAQEKMIDLETDLEELHDSEQRWAAKHKRNIEQTEHLQLKLIQEKALNDQLETDKAVMERQLRELRLEVDELQSSSVQEDVISRAESRVKELENFLRTEERNKAVLTNTVGKLERRINELSDQMEEEHRISTEQKDLMNQRIRSLKRQLNETEEEASRKEAQYRHTQRELTEERETSSRLQRQLLDQHLQSKRKESMTIRQTLDNLRLDLSVDDEDEEQRPLSPPQSENVSQV